MCRPLWSCWVDGERAYTVPGEGGHQEIRAALWDVPILREGVNGNLPWQPFECRWPRERVALWQPNTDRFYRMSDLPSKQQFDIAQEACDREIGTPDRLRDWVMAAYSLYGHGQEELPGALGQNQSPFFAWPPQSCYANPLSGSGRLTLAGMLCQPAVSASNPSARPTIYEGIMTAALSVLRPHALYGLITDWIARANAVPPLAMKKDTDIITRRDKDKLMATWADAFSHKVNRVPIWAN